MTLFDRFDPIDEGLLLGWGEVESRHSGWFGDGAEEVSVVGGDLDGPPLADDFLGFVMEAFERGARKAGAIERVAGGVEEDGALPNAFDFFEEDAVESAEGDIAEEPLAVVDGEQAFEVFQDDGLAGGAVDDALWEVNGGWGLVAGAVGIGIDGFGLKGGGVGVVFFKR